MVEGTNESLIVLSDVHLGSDLVAQGSATRRRSRENDAELVRLIDHYRDHPPQHGRWRLVIAGDLIDFIGMVIPSDQVPLETAPSEEERAHGLGNARDHAVAKMRAVAHRHREVFDALGAFVAEGHAMTIIHGNHDLELHWEDVRQELTETVWAAAEAHASKWGRALERGDFLQRIEYSPWFFYRDGVAYIEHGHQYDAYCATEHLLAPLSPADPRRVARGFCDVLLRFVVRQTPGLSEHGHESMGIFDYLRFGRRLGPSGMLALGLRYVRAIRELFRLRREHLLEATQEILAQHEQAMARLARARRLRLRRLRALWKLQAKPVTRSVSGILGSLLVDRLALGALSGALLAGLVVTGLFEPFALLGVVVVVPAWLVGERVLTRRRNIDPVGQLAARAGAVASLFPAPFIVMGHTHVPAREALGGDATYINVGSWAEDDDGAFPASRAHLVIHPGVDRPVAHFLRWDGERGPTAYDG